MIFSRAFISDGDATTAGGRVQVGPQRQPFLLNDRQGCFEGEPVLCPACNSTGVTRCVPPFRPYTGVDGRQINLDGDLCLCRCPTPPRLVASNPGNTMSFIEAELAAQPGASGWMAYDGHDGALTSHDEHFVVCDSATGQPASGFAYGLRTVAGEYQDETGADGKTVKTFAEGADEVSLTYVVQMHMGIRP